MAAGLKTLRKYQFGKESTHGTAVAATAKIIGNLGIQYDPLIYAPDDLQYGLFSKRIFSSVIGVNAKLPFDGTVTFEQILYFLAMSVKGGVTASGGPNYVWNYQPNLTALNNPDTFTVEIGDDVQCYKSAYVFAKDLQINGSLTSDNAPLKVKANLVGQTVAQTTFTPAIGNPASWTPATMSTAKLYIDNSWANLGTTNIGSTLLTFDWKLDEAVIPVKWADGQLYFTDRAEKKRGVILTLDVAHNSTIAGLFSSVANQTPQFVRVEFTSGSNKLTFDGCYMIQSPFDPLSKDREEQDIVPLKLGSIYDGTSSNEWLVKVTNAVATLP